MTASSACDHTTQNSRWEYDVRGIPLVRTCSKCRKARLSGYRPEVLTEGQQIAVYGKVKTSEVYDEEVLPLDSDY
jgi:hypothetical protein